MVKLCGEAHYMWWGDQELGLQELDDFINAEKITILAIIIVSNNNP